MPLIKRSISPINVSLHRLPESIQTDELECVANGTLANLVRQLSSLSRHAEHIIGEIYHETVKIDHKTNTLAQRIERLTNKVTQLDCNQEQVSLEDLHMRKPFKSSTLIDQHTLDRQTLPSALSECYTACDQPPNLDALNPYRDDEKSALKYYTDPSYFFDLWRKEMLKEMDDGRRARAIKSPTDNKSPSRKKRNRQQQQQQQLTPTSGGTNELLRHQTTPVSRYMTTTPTTASTQRSAADMMMHFPAEYQAPQIIRTNEQLQAPIGMSVPFTNGSCYITSSTCASSAASPLTATSPSATTAATPTAAVNTAISTTTALNVPSPIAEEMIGGESRSLSDQLANVGLMDDVDVDDDDDELPPPPPPLMHTSLVCQMPSAAPTMQFVAPSDNQQQYQHQQQYQYQHHQQQYQQQHQQQQKSPLTATLVATSQNQPSAGATQIVTKTIQPQATAIASFANTSNSNTSNSNTATGIVTSSITTTINTATGTGTDNTATGTGITSNITSNLNSNINSNDEQHELQLQLQHQMMGTEMTAEQQLSSRSNLLAEIQSGIKLKQVQRKEQAAEEKAAAEANDVAAILRRRMEHVLGNSDTDTDSQSNDDEEWD